MLSLNNYHEKAQSNKTGFPNIICRKLFLLTRYAHLILNLIPGQNPRCNYNAMFSLVEGSQIAVVDTL